MKTLHLMVTSLCGRNCPHCCNKQHDLPPQVTDEDIAQCDTLCITGGEPFLFSNPVEIAKYYRRKYQNIHIVYVYTNATELLYYLQHRQDVSGFKLFDGLNIGIKNKDDLLAFSSLIYELSDVFKEKIYLISNRVYLMMSDSMNALAYKSISDFLEKVNLKAVFSIIDRKWQENFVPADNSIFRRA